MGGFTNDVGERDAPASARIEDQHGLALTQTKIGVLNRRPIWLQKACRVRFVKGAVIMLQRDSLPTKDQVLSFGARHNAGVWEKHRDHLAENALDSAPAIRALDAAKLRTGNKLSRQHVFEIADQETAAGVVASIIWGFPKGGLQGRIWKPLASAFAAAHHYAQVIEDIRARGNVPASKALERINAVLPGVGFATTSKIAYFARLSFAEGQALIYDKNVIEAIKYDQKSGFDRTQNYLGPGTTFYHKGTSSYGHFIADANTLAQNWSVSPDQIETGLFQLRAPARSGWS